MGLQALFRGARLIGNGDRLETGIEEKPLDLLAVFALHHDDDHVAVHLAGKKLLVGDVDLDIVCDMPGKNGKLRVPAIEFQVKGDHGKRFEFLYALFVLLLPRLQSRTR